MDPARSFLALVALPELPADWRERAGRAIGAAFGEAFERDPRIAEGIAGSVGEERLRVVAVEEPIPDAVLSGPIEGAWYWPEAEDELAKQRAHLVCVAKGPADGSPRLRALVLTRLLAILLRELEGLGIVWGGAPSLHSAAAFLASADEMTPERLPLRLWVDFQVWRNDDGTHSLRTNGMEPFGRHELEVHGSKMGQDEVASWAYNVAHYMLEKGIEVEDGHAVGKSPSEWIRIHHVPSAFDREKTVYYLDLEAEK